MLGIYIIMITKMEEEQKVSKHRYKTYKKYFEEWKHNPVFCPYLGCKVLATKSGWEHIAGLDKSRGDADIHRRLDLFKYAKNIVSRSGTCQYIRPGRAGDKYYTFESVEAFKDSFSVGKKLKKIRVVIIKTSSGTCKFHSVMD
jgi:hypothetical protein